MSTRDQMEAARAYIKAKDYRSARRILRQVDHPKAQAWLRQLDQRDPQRKPVPRRVWQAISLLSAGIGVFALVVMVLIGLATAKSGGGYGELAFWVGLVVILLPVSYFTNRLGRQA